MIRLKIPQPVSGGLIFSYNVEVLPNNGGTLNRNSERIPRSLLRG